MGTLQHRTGPNAPRGRRPRTRSRGAALLASIALGIASGGRANAAPPAPVPGPPPPANAPAPPAAPPNLTPKGFDEGLVTRANGTQVYFYRTNFVPPGELVTTVKTLLDMPGVSLK